MNGRLQQPAKNSKVVISTALSKLDSIKTVLMPFLQMLHSESGNNSMNPWMQKNLVVTLQDARAGCSVVGECFLGPLNADLSWFKFHMLSGCCIL